MSFGVIFALYLATNGMMSLVTTFNHFYKTKFTHSLFRYYLVVPALTVMLSFVLSVAMILLVGGQVTLNFLLDIGILNKDFLLYLIMLLRFVRLRVTFRLMISLIYFYGPSVEDQWHFLNPEPIIATFLSIGISYIF